MSFSVFDPRILGTAVYERLSDLRQKYDDIFQNNKINKKVYDSHLKEQKNQAVELYTYLATWGLMRLKAEEIALSKHKENEPHPDKLSPEKKAERNQEGKREVIKVFFQCLEYLSSDKDSPPKLDLKKLKGMDLKG